MRFLSPSLTLVGFTSLLASAVALTGCGSSDPSTPGGTGATNGSGAGAGAGATGGTNGAGAGTGAGGQGTGGTGSGGTATGAGGSTGNAGGTSSTGGTNSGAGGTSAGGTSGGAGGSTGGGGGSGPIDTKPNAKARGHRRRCRRATYASARSASSTTIGARRLGLQRTHERLQRLRQSGQDVRLELRPRQLRHGQHQHEARLPADRVRRPPLRQRQPSPPRPTTRPPRSYRVRSRTSRAPV